MTVKLVCDISVGISGHWSDISVLRRKCKIDKIVVGIHRICLAPLPLFGLYEGSLILCKCYLSDPGQIQLSMTCVICVQSHITLVKITLFFYNKLGC